MDRLCNYIIARYSELLSIQENEKEIYIYGLKIIISKLIFSIFIIVFCMIYTEYIIPSSLFVFSFFNVRMYSGGLHVNKTISCLIIFIVCYLLLIFFLYVKTDIEFYAVLVLMFINLIVIEALSPIDCAKKQLTNVQKKQNNKKAVKNTRIWIFISIIACYFDVVEVKITLLYSITLISLFLLISVYKKERRLMIFLHKE